MRVKIHHEGANILVVLLLAVLVINVPLWLWVRPLIWPIVSTTVFGVTYMLVVNFFRSPRRIYTGDPTHAVVSSADGKVVALEEVYEPEVLKCRCIQLSVFMSILNVHANWFPVDGEVTFVKHHAGRFMAAYLPKSSTENDAPPKASRYLCARLPERWPAASSPTPTPAWRHASKTTWASLNSARV